LATQVRPVDPLYPAAARVDYLQWRDERSTIQIADDITG